jgi:hypothetical protein
MKVTHHPLLLVRAPRPIRRIEEENDRDAELRLARKLDYLRTVAFPITKEFDFTYVLHLDNCHPCEPELCISCMKWTCVKEWQILVMQLLNGSIDQWEYTIPFPFDSCIYISLRDDDGEPGMGYGKREYWSERCVFRACLLMSRGNVLFMDWGKPSGYPREAMDESYPLEDIAKTYDWEYYFYHDRESRLPQIRNGIEMYAIAPGFSQLVRLGHWLHPITSYKDVLPENYINKAHQVMTKQMFDKVALRKALWIAHWSLFFAMDNVYLYYYKSKWFPQQQEDLVVLWENLRTWWSGSTHREDELDVCAFIIVMIFHGLLLVPACLESVVWMRRHYFTLLYPVPQPEIVEWTVKGMTIWNGLMFVFWAFVHDWRCEIYYRGQFDSRDRPHIWQRLKLFISISIWGTFGTLTMICLWRQWWLETVAWVMVAFVYYRVKKLWIG